MVNGVGPHTVKCFPSCCDILLLVPQMKIKTGHGIIIFLATPSTPPTSIIRSRLRCLHVMPRAARQHPVGGRITSCSILHSNHRAHHPLLFACLFALYVTGHTEKCFSILKKPEGNKKPVVSSRCENLQHV